MRERLAHLAEALVCLHVLMRSSQLGRVCADVRWSHEAHGEQGRRESKLLFQLLIERGVPWNGDDDARVERRIVPGNKVKSYLAQHAAAKSDVGVELFLTAQDLCRGRYDCGFSQASCLKAFGALQRVGCREALVRKDDLLDARGPSPL